MSTPALTQGICMSELLPLPEPVTTIGPCMFGGEPSVATDVYTAAQMHAYALACLSARSGAGVDGSLQGDWLFPVSGWVRGSDFVPVSGADTESRLSQGWQPVAYVRQLAAVRGDAQPPAPICTCENENQCQGCAGGRAASDARRNPPAPSGLTDAEREALDTAEADLKYARRQRSPQIDSDLLFHGRNLTDKKLATLCTALRNFIKGSGQ